MARAATPTLAEELALAQEEHEEEDRSTTSAQTGGPGKTRAGSPTSQKGSPGRVATASGAMSEPGSPGVR